MSAPGFAPGRLGSREMLRDALDCLACQETWSARLLLATLYLVLAPFAAALYTISFTYLAATAAAAATIYVGVMSPVWLLGAMRRAVARLAALVRRASARNEDDTDRLRPQLRQT